MTTNANSAKRRPILSIQLPEDLEGYLRERADAGYRSVSKEVVMRLEQSRQADLNAAASKAQRVGTDR